MIVVVTPLGYSGQNFGGQIQQGPRRPGFFCHALRGVNADTRYQVGQAEKAGLFRASFSATAI